MKVQMTTQTTVGDVGYIKDILEAGIEQEEHANIRRWLYPDGTNAEAGFTAALGTKQSETGKWILDSEDFMAWRESTHGCMWIYGIGEILLKKFGWLLLNCF